MSCILNIETSTSVCSVALSMDGEVLFAKASFDGPSHAALLGVFVEEALSVLKKKGKNIRITFMKLCGRITQLMVLHTESR